MRTLSDDITLKVETTDISQGYAETTIYANDTLVFRGQAYLPGDNSPLEVNINDIASQNRGKYDHLKLNDDGVLTSTPMMYNTVYGNYRFYPGQICTYEVDLDKRTGSSDDYYDESETIIAGYDYPNKDLKPTSLDTSVSSLCRIMQGCDWIYNHDEEVGSFNNLLLPHYPYIATEKYGMGLQLWGSLADRWTKKYELQCETGSNVSLGTVFYVIQNSDSTFLTLKDLVDGFNIGNIDNDTSIYLKLTGESEDEFGDWVEGKYYGTCPVAVFDKCYSRYYLAWMDRYGDVMSQPFNGKPEYTEKIENSEIQDYKLRRRVVHKQIQPIWKLNTGWIKEDIYPMYEAMFTSPYLLLYDTQTDRSWNVILTDTDYKEKTYKTERSLISLEITLEANKKQNYIF